MDRMSGFADKSEAEFKRYESTGDDQYLAQAGEKLWNVFNLYVQKKIGRKVTNYGAMKKAVAELYSQGGSNLLLTTFKNAYDLHIFFYRGWTEDINEIVELYHETRNGMKTLGAL
jgi:hypothetical protein